MPSNEHPRRFIVGVAANNKRGHKRLENFPSQPLIECFINNTKVTALIDTGSMVFILSPSVLDRLPDKPLLRNSDSNTCISITGQSLSSQGEILGHLQFSGSSHFYHTRFVICSNVLQPLECILSWDFLLSNQLHLLLHNSGYFLEGSHGKSPILPAVKDPIALSPVDSPGLEQSFHRGSVPLTLVSSIIIPARSEVVLMTRVHRRSCNALGMVAPLSSNFSPSGLFPAYSVSVVDHRFVPVRFVNTNKDACELHQGQRIADFCPVSPQIHFCFADDTRTCFSRGCC